RRIYHRPQRRTILPSKLTQPHLHRPQAAPAPKHPEAASTSTASTGTPTRARETHDSLAALTHTPICTSPVSGVSRMSLSSAGATAIPFTHNAAAAPPQSLTGTGTSSIPGVPGTKTSSGDRGTGDSNRSEGDISSTAPPSSRGATGDKARSGALRLTARGPGPSRPSPGIGCRDPRTTDGDRR